MGRGAWIKKTALVLVLIFGFNTFVGAEMSIGEAVFKFVTSSFLGDTFGDISKAGSNIIKSATKILPIPDIQELLKKLKVTVMILRVLKAIQAPDNIKIEQFLSVVKKIAGSGAAMADMSAEIGRIAASLTCGSSLPVSKGPSLGLNTGAGLNVLEDGSSLNLGADLSLNVDTGALMPPAPETLGLSAGAELSLDTDNLGLSSGYGSAQETDPGAIITVIDKFLQLIQDNAEFIEQAGSVVDALDTAANPADILKSKITGYFDGQAAPLMEKYGITTGDISTAEELVSGKYDSSMEKIRAIVSLLGRGSETIATLDQLVEIYDSMNGRTEMSREKGMEILIKVVKLLPATADAVGGMAGGK